MPCVCTKYPLKLCPYFGHSAILIPSSYIASFVLYGPLGAAIGQNVRGWNGRRSSTLNNIGGVRFRTFFKLAECEL